MVCMGEEVSRLGGKGVAVDPQNPGGFVSTWLLARRQEGPLGELLVGLDPGPRPGCAFLGDGTPLGKHVAENVTEALERLVDLVDTLQPSSVRVRIGHGSPNHRDQLINEVLALGFYVEEVNEHRTSSGRSRHDHGSAALKIAMQPGTPVHEQRANATPLGELKNIQRMSRQQSNGALTISSSWLKPYRKGPSPWRRRFTARVIRPRRGRMLALRGPTPGHAKASAGTEPQLLGAKPPPT